MLELNKSVVSIDLTSNNLKPKAIDQFLDRLVMNNVIVKLDFKSTVGQFRNQIGDGLSFRSYIGSNAMLQFLCVSRSNLTPVIINLCLNILERIGEYFARHADA